MGGGARQAKPRSLIERADSLAQRVDRLASARETVVSVDVIQRSVLPAQTPQGTSAKAGTGAEAPLPDTERSGRKAARAPADALQIVLMFTVDDEELALDKPAAGCA